MMIGAAGASARDLRATGDGRCHLCRGPVSRRNATRDHLVPRSRGGTDDDDNLGLAHRRCNSARGSLTMAEVGALRDELDRARPNCGPGDLQRAMRRAVGAAARSGA